MKFSIVAVWFLAFSIYLKELFDFSVFGFNFALWDLFILFPLFFTRVSLTGAYPLVALSILYIIVVILSGLLNPVFSQSSLGYVLQYLRCVVIFFTFKTFLERNPIIVHQHLYFSFLLFNGLTLLLASLGFQESLGEVSVGERWRLGGFVGDPNLFGFYAVLCFLSLFYLFERHQIRFPVLIISTLFLGYILLLTGSRSAIGLYLGLGLVFLFRTNFKTGAVVTGLLVIPMLVVFYSSLHQLYVFFQHRFSSPDSRLGLWRNLFDTLEMDKWFGHGVKSVVNQVGNFAHNDWLTAFYELGILGIVTFAFINFWVYFSVLRLRLFFIVPSFLMTFLFSIFVQPVIWLFWLLLNSHVRVKT